MAINYGHDELDLAHQLMVMALTSVVAQVFELSPDELTLDLRLVEDLNMDEQLEDQLEELIGEYFDDLALDISRLRTLEDLFDQVIHKRFEIA